LFVIALLQDDKWGDGEWTGSDGAGDWTRNTAVLVPPLWSVNR